MSRQQQYRHFSEIVTDEVLTHLAARAVEEGDIVMVMRCEHAKVDDLARRDVAICLDERWAEPLDQATIENLSPEIRGLVRGLRAAGFHTSDSGDGTNWKQGMDCALPYRHVAIMCAYWQDPEAEAERARRYLAWIGADDEFEVLVAAPMEGMPGILFVSDKRADEICEEVGYVPPDPADYEDAEEPDDGVREDG